MYHTSGNVADGIVRKRLLRTQHEVMKFEELRQQYYHRVSASPSEQRVRGLLYSDIVLHLPVLEWYASLCSHVTEFGVRDGHSTVAFLSGCTGEVHSYDVSRGEAVSWLEADRGSYRASWHFHYASTVDEATPVAETDLIFFDTLHTHDHLGKELALHGRKARKYLVFHDTETCGQKDLTGPDPQARGITSAIAEYLASYVGEYETVYSTKWCNGLLVLERKRAYGP